jgi:hypothetical protein
MFGLYKVVIKRWYWVDLPKAVQNHNQLMLLAICKKFKKNVRFRTVVFRIGQYFTQFKFSFSISLLTPMATILPSGFPPVYNRRLQRR